MKLKNIFSAVLAVSALAVFTACSSDADYVVGAQSPGAFFSSENPSTVSLSEDQTSFTVQVGRTSADALSAASITAVDENGLFTIPSSVSFSGDNLLTDLTITYNPADLEYDKQYPITLTVSDGSNYGDTTYDLIVVKPAPYIVDNSKSTTGDYTYTQFFSGVDSNLDVTYKSNKYDENQVVYTVSDWGYGVDLNITMDMSKRNADGLIPVTVAETYIGYEHSSYGSVYVADGLTYVSAVAPEYADQYVDASGYDDQTGTFYLYMYYYVSAGTFGGGYETLQLAGFPDYDVNISYKGTYTDADETQTQAIVSVSVGADATAKVALASGTDYTSLAKGIISGSVEATEIEAGDDQILRFNVNGAGQYTVVAVSYADGEAMNYDYTTFTISSGTVESDADQWTSIGYADFEDGWLLGGMADSAGNPFDPADAPSTVEVQRNKENPGIYRLVNPYLSEDNAMAYYNENTKNTNIVIDLSDPECPIIEPQYSGFTSTSFTINRVAMGDFYIANFEGVYYSEGYEKDAIKANMNEDYRSSFEDDILYIPVPLWGCAATDNEVGYTWYNDIADIFPTVIYFPEGTSAAHKKASAKVKANKSSKKFKNVSVKPVKSISNAKSKTAIKKAYKLKSKASLANPKIFNVRSK